MSGGIHDRFGTAGAQGTRQRVSEVRTDRVAGICRGFLCQAKEYGYFLTVDTVFYLFYIAAHFKKGSVMKRSVLEEYSLPCK